MTVTAAPDFPSPSIVDSRRLMGPNLYSARMGAVLEVTVDAAHAESLLENWAAHARRVFHALGWGSAELHVRREKGGASLFLAAPVDALMTATDVNEQAWVAAESLVGEHTYEIPVDRLRVAADLER